MTPGLAAVPGLGFLFFRMGIPPPHRSPPGAGNAGEAASRVAVPVGGVARGSRPAPGAVPQLAGKRSCRKSRGNGEKGSFFSLLIQSVKHTGDLNLCVFKNHFFTSLPWRWSTWGGENHIHWSSPQRVGEAQISTIRDNKLFFQKSGSETMIWPTVAGCGVAGPADAAPGTPGAAAPDGTVTSTRRALCRRGGSSTGHLRGGQRRDRGAVRRAAGSSHGRGGRCLRPSSRRTAWRRRGRRRRREGGEKAPPPSASSANAF